MCVVSSEPAQLCEPASYLNSLGRCALLRTCRPVVSHTGPPGSSSESQPGSSNLAQHCPLTFYLASQGLADHSCVLLLVPRPLVHKQGCVGGASIKHDPKLKTTLRSERCRRLLCCSPSPTSSWLSQTNLGVCRQENIGRLHQDEDEHGEARGRCDSQQGREDPLLPGESHSTRSRAARSGEQQWTSDSTGYTSPSLQGRMTSWEPRSLASWGAGAR